MFPLDSHELTQHKGGLNIIQIENNHGKFEFLRRGVNHTKLACNLLVNYETTSTSLGVNSKRLFDGYSYINNDGIEIIFIEYIIIISLYDLHFSLSYQVEFVKRGNLLPYFMVDL